MQTMTIFPPRKQIHILYSLSFDKLLKYHNLSKLIDIHFPVKIIRTVKYSAAKGLKFRGLFVSVLQSFILSCQYTELINVSVRI